MSINEYLVASVKVLFERFLVASVKVLFMILAPLVGEGDSVMIFVVEVKSSEPWRVGGAVAPGPLVCYS